MEMGGEKEEEEEEEDLAVKVAQGELHVLRRCTGWVWVWVWVWMWMWV